MFILSAHSSRLRDLKRDQNARVGRWSGNESIVIRLRRRWVTTRFVLRVRRPNILEHKRESHGASSSLQSHSLQRAAASNFHARKIGQVLFLKIDTTTISSNSADHRPMFILSARSGRLRDQKRDQKAGHRSVVWKRVSDDPAEAVAVDRCSF